MLTDARSRPTVSMESAIEELLRAAESVRTAAAASSATQTLGALCVALRTADDLTATALGMLSRLSARGTIEATTGLVPEMLLMLEGRRTGAEARTLSQAAATLSQMPQTAAAFQAGAIGWGQVRAITAAVRTLDAKGREAIDGLVGAEALSNAGEPDELIARVDDAVATLRADLALAREDRSIQGGFLAVQTRLTGGASFYGEADTESIATMLEALDHVAADPVDPDAAGAPSRAQQRFDALIGICEASLAGDHGSVRTRPRPRLIATVDIQDVGEERAARVLGSLIGRPARLTPVATEMLSCDSQVVPVIFEGGRPIAVGDATAQIAPRLRTALIARDSGCRFPGCGAPVAWCDAHHMRPRSRGGPTQIDNLVLLCRRCHRRVHRFAWRIALESDGSIAFHRRGKTYSSAPRARPLARE